MSKKVKVTNGKICFGVLFTAIEGANFSYSSNDSSATLVWFDTLKALDYFSELKPWQIVNRIPGINVLCRKVPFTILLQRMMKLLPDELTFLPKSFILPRQLNDLQTYVNRYNQTIIVKPDNGSLGSGINLFLPGTKLPRAFGLSVAQVLIEPLLIDSIKFDFRIYALIASIMPLTIFVYRDGVARFCAENYSKSSRCGYITNTFVNKQKATLDSITKTVSEVMITLQKNGISPENLWKEIDKIIVLTVLSGIGFIEESSKDVSNPNRCFQILGFDIMIDSNKLPKILEVNYRPSMECGTESERKMKKDLLSKSMQIVMHGWYDQDVVSSYADDVTRLYNLPPPPKRNLVSVPGFVQVFPPLDKGLNQRYNRIISEVRRLSIKTSEKKVPFEVMVHAIDFEKPLNSNEFLPFLEKKSSRRKKLRVKSETQSEKESTKEENVEEKKEIVVAKTPRNGGEVSGRHLKSTRTVASQPQSGWPKLKTNTLQLNIVTPNVN